MICGLFGVMPNNASKIAELEAILQAGVTTRTIAGTTVTYDFAVIRQQLAELRAQDPTQAARKPRTATIDLGGGW